MFNELQRVKMKFSMTNNFPFPFNIHLYVSYNLVIYAYWNYQEVVFIMNNRY